MDILAVLTNYWLDEFLVVLVAGALLLGAELYIHSRGRPIIEISSTSLGDKLGFILKVKRKSLEHPRVHFFGGYTRPDWGGDLHPCELFDEKGSIYKDNFISAGGRPVKILPLVAKREVKVLAHLDHY